MVLVPRSILEANLYLDEQPKRGETGKVVLVMSHDNVVALLVLFGLSILGTLYLWKICTQRSCVCRICRNQYRQLHLIGSGGYGAVYLVQRFCDDSRFVAKKILVSNITEVDEYSKEAKELVTLRHRHIVSYEEDFVHVEYGAFEPKTYFIIVMEYCPEGDLKEKIEVDFCSFTEEWVRTVFAQLLQAVQYLHSKNVIHRDLKSQNVFLAQDGRVRLGDFGLCKHTRNPGVGTATFSHAGTDCYMAPEMLSSSRYGKPADIWSLGCVLYELVAGHFMWELDGILGAMVMTDAQTVPKLILENACPAVGSALRSLLKRLLSIKPDTRPTATTIIRKKLFKKGFPLSRQTFGESWGEPAQDADTPPGAQGEGSGSGSDGSPQAQEHADDFLPSEGDDGGVESSSSSSSSGSSDEASRKHAPTPRLCNDSLLMPRTKRRRRRNFRR